MRSFRLVFPILIVFLMMLACGSATKLQTPVIGGKEETSAPTAVVDTASPTNTKGPTNTPKPTNTPRPTNTPKPTLTPTPVPEPIVLEGSGDQIVDVKKGDYPAIIHLVYTGRANFIVHSYDANGEYLEGLVNEIGAYDGIRPLDVMQGEQTARLEIKSSGPWTITIYPLDLQYMHVVDVPGSYSAKGDDVIALTGKEPDLATFDYKGDANFIVHSYGASGFDGLVNEIGTYHGQVIVPRDAFILEVIAAGGASWSVDITSR